MKYEANIYQMIVETHTFWVAESKVLKGCIGQGDTSEDAIKELEINENEWIETATEVGIPIPPRTAREPLKHTGKFALRLAPNVYAESCAIANELGISLNQYFNNAVTTYNVNTKAFLRKPVSNEKDKDVASKIIDFKPPVPAPVVYEITRDLEEM